VISTRAPEIIVFSPTEFAAGAASLIADKIRNAIGERESCRIALSGGSTPVAVYRQLARPGILPKDAWNRIDVWSTDERMVPPDHPDSNYGMIHRELLSRVPILSNNIHRIRGEERPESAAESYGNEVRGIPRMEFELIVLGVGTDGHTASLFPPLPDLPVSSPPAMVVDAPDGKYRRVTLSLDIINRAWEILILVTGSSKAEIVERILSKGTPARDLPASMIAPLSGRCAWILDSDSAVKIKRP
jgi:6-phosphogluconolactonase